MNLKKLLKMQQELDDTILTNVNYGKDIDYCLEHQDFLTEEILALSVEVGEFANATRCFKFWSQKGPESKERLLDEFADILHFYLSIANAMNFTAEDIEQAYLNKNKTNYQRQKEGY